MTQSSLTLNTLSLPKPSLDAFTAVTVRDLIWMVQQGYLSREGALLLAPMNCSQLLLKAIDEEAAA